MKMFNHLKHLTLKKVTTLDKPVMCMHLSIRNTVNLALIWNFASVEDIQKASILGLLP